MEIVGFTQQYWFLKSVVLSEIFSLYLLIMFVTVWDSVSLRLMTWNYILVVFDELWTSFLLVSCVLALSNLEWAIRFEVFKKKYKKKYIYIFLSVRSMLFFAQGR